RFRQSSPMPARSWRSHWISWPYSPRMSAWVCGQHWPKPKHSRTPFQAAAGLGGIQRFLPPVDAPYGMPLNSQIGPLAMPCTLPLAISVVWKIFDDPPPAARPAGGLAGGVGAWASAFGAAAVAASAAP